MYSVIILLLCAVTLSHQHLTKDGVKCECVKSMRCKYWVSAVSRGKYLELPVCGYDDDTLVPLLCCPSADDWMSKANRTKREVQSLQGLDNIQLSCTVTSHRLTSPANIAKQKCDEYGKLIFQSIYEVSVGGSPYQLEKFDTCGRSDEEDKEKAVPREFPHMTHIGFGEKDIEWLCAGSLISERFILSSAVCSNSRGAGAAKWAKLGDLDISTDEDVAKPQHYKISDSIVYPEYNRSLVYHDIALFKLDRDVTFTIYVRPACLFTRRDPPDNKADSIGWGRKAVSDPALSKTLKKIQMDLVSTKDCNKVYNDSSNVRLLPHGIQPDSIICANEANDAGPQLCGGDNGGPLQIPLKEPYCMHGIIGVVSLVRLCGPVFPNIFARVSHYVPWIVKNVWSE